MNQVRLVSLEPEVKRDLRESAGTLEYQVKMGKMQTRSMSV